MIENGYDMAVVGGQVLTMDPAFTGFSDALILIRDGRICHIGERKDYPSGYEAVRTIHAQGKLIFPAFFNGHTHLSVSLYRGLGGDLKLHDWLRRIIWPLEKQYCNPDNVYLGSCLSLLEMIRSGTGTLADMNFFSTYAARAIEDSGLRGFIGEALFSNPTPSIRDPEDGFSVVSGLVDRYRGSQQIIPYLVLHAPFTCSARMYEQAAGFAKEKGLKVCSHVAETRTEQEQFLSSFGLTPAAWLDKTGVLGSDFIAIHAVHLTEGDKQIFARRQVSVIHNPHSNMMLGSGICPVSELMGRGIPVGLGTDSASSNNNLSMLTELQTAAKLQKMQLMDPSALPARDVVRMATGINARIYGLEEVTGRLAEGYSADLIIVDPDTPNMQPLYDPYVHMAYSMENSNIITLVAGGRLIMEDRKILTLDEKLILSEVDKWSRSSSVYDFIRIEDD